MWSTSITSLVSVDVIDEAPVVPESSEAVGTGAVDVVLVATVMGLEDHDAFVVWLDGVVEEQCLES